MPSIIRLQKIVLELVRFGKVTKRFLKELLRSACAILTFVGFEVIRRGASFVIIARELFIFSLDSWFLICSVVKIQ